MSNWLIGRRSLIAAGIAVLILAGLGSAWALYATAPLLEDNFNDRWFDMRIWAAPMRLSKEIGVREEFGYLRLLNRGCIVTKEEFEKPISIEFDWSWVDLVGDPFYADSLAVALRTSGDRSPKHAYEMLDGIVVRFNAWAGKVSIGSMTDPNDPISNVTTPDGTVAIATDSWHKIRITDDGETIAVYIAGPEFHSKDPERPVLELKCSASSGSHHVAIYNRELVGGAPHESRIDNFVIRPLHPDKSRGE